jgi:hypothetical protein
MRRRLVLLLLLVASPVAAEVKSASNSGFEVERKAIVFAPPAEVYGRIARIGTWWNVAHSYSGKAANLSLETRAGGCFCEKLDNGGSVEHMRVVYADPARGLRLQGGLGPLQSEAVNGTLSWSFKSVQGGTALTQNYVVAGTARGGLQIFAAPVDQVLGDQFDRLVAALAR